MPISVVALPIEVLVDVLRFSSGAEILAFCCTVSNNDGKGLYAVRYLQKGKWRVILACFCTRAPLYYYVIGIYRLTWVPRPLPVNFHTAFDEVVLRDLTVGSDTAADAGAPGAPGQHT